MHYSKVIEGVFLSRPNRFIAEVEINGTVERVHVKNTGRCRELLVPGGRCYLSDSGNPACYHQELRSLHQLLRRLQNLSRDSEDRGLGL